VCKQWNRVRWAADWYRLSLPGFRFEDWFPKEDFTEEEVFFRLMKEFEKKKYYPKF
jgi:hypothetical protein